MKYKQHNIDRRQFFKTSGALGLGTASSLGGTYKLVSHAERADGAEALPKYLFTICTTGGASVVDSFLAQTSGPAAYADLTKPGGSPFSAVPVLANSIQGAIPLGNGYPSATFITKHGADMTVMTCEVSSVNHLIAAKRAMTGDSVYGGKTIAEAVALHYGAQHPLANLLLAGGGYGAEGDDRLLPAFARGQMVADPLMFAFATHGFKGLNQSLSAGEIDGLRKLRGQLEAFAPMMDGAKKSPLAQGYIAAHN